MGVGDGSLASRFLVVQSFKHHRPAQLAGQVR